MIKPHTEKNTIIQHRLTNIQITSDICDHVNCYLSASQKEDRYIKRGIVVNNRHGNYVSLTQLPGP